MKLDPEFQDGKKINEYVGKIWDIFTDRYKRQYGIERDTPFNVFSYDDEAFPFAEMIHTGLLFNNYDAELKKLAVNDEVDIPTSSITENVNMIVDKATNNTHLIKLKKALAHMNSVMGTFYIGFVDLDVFDAKESGSLNGSEKAPYPENTSVI